MPTYPNALIGLDLAGYFVFLCVLLAALIVLFWVVPRRQKRRRRRFLSARDPSRLRTNPANPRIVYQIDDPSGDVVTAEMIWRDNAPVTTEPPFKAAAENFAPFDPVLFVDRPMG